MIFETKRFVLPAYPAVASDFSLMVSHKVRKPQSSLQLHLPPTPHLFDRNTL